MSYEALYVDSTVADLEETRRALRERLDIFLEEVQPALRVDIVQVLAGTGKLLCRPASLLDGRWALLPLYLACDLQPEVNMNLAGTVALALECVICSTDLLDDAMDGDMTPPIQQLGVARSLNVSLALMCLAQRMLLSLSELAVPAALQFRLLETLQRSLLLASAGQQRDLLAEGRAACELTWEECIEIAAGKAGALLSLACQLGAICAGAPGSCVEQCAELGRLLGIAAQLDNDAHDLSHLLQLASAEPLEHQKSDLTRSKKTLPVVLAARSLHATSAWHEQRIDSAFRNLALLVEEERTTCLSALREGILGTWGIALLYRERARDCLREIEHGGPLSQRLLLVLGLQKEHFTDKER